MTLQYGMNVVNKWATLLNGRDRANNGELTRDEKREAKEDGVLIVFGASDDLCEFEGAFQDEAGCYEGGTARITVDGVWNSQCDDDDCPYAEVAREKEAVKITIHWNEDGDKPTWTYETQLPHEKFLIMDEDEKYCEGMVIAKKDIEQAIADQFYR